MNEEYRGKRINIAMDGPVGAGKSSVADEVARRLSILHLDTGAMYRAVGLAVLRASLDPQDEAAATRICEAAEIDVRYENGKQRTLLNGEDVTDLLRTEEVSLAASAVAKWPAVRRRMVKRQQELAAEHDMLIDGRDIGTRVLPDAPVKIYLTADARVRAERRRLQLLAKGTEVPFEEVLRDLLLRDEQDMHRETDPLQVADGAVVVDSTDLTEEETVERILSVAEAQYGGDQKA